MESRASWRSALFISLLLHLLILIGPLSFWRLPKADPIKPTALKSYLVIQQPSLPPARPDINKQTTSVSKPNLEKAPELEIEPITKPVIKDDEIQPVENEVIIDDAFELEGTAATSSIPSIDSIRLSLQNKLIHESTNFNTWQQQQQLVLPSRGNQAPTLFKPFIQQGNGIKELAQSADGSRLIKVQGNCFVVKQNERRENEWLSEACPQSAAPLREAFRKSMAKYTKSKN